MNRLSQGKTERHSAVANEGRSGKLASSLAMIGVVCVALSAPTLAVADDAYLRSAIGELALTQPLAEVKAAMQATNGQYEIKEILSSDGSAVIGFTGVEKVEGEMTDGMLVVMKQGKVASINRHQLLAADAALSGEALRQTMLEQYGQTPSFEDGSSFKVLHWEYDRAGTLAEDWGTVCSKNAAVYELEGAMFDYPYGPSDDCSVTVTVMARAENMMADDVTYNRVVVRVSDVSAF